MNKCKFDLQLFADGDDTATHADSQDTSFVEQIRSNDEADKLAAIRQWRTQEEKPIQEDQEEEVEPMQEEEEVPESEETPTQEQMLDLDADDFEKIDPNKLPPELKAVYKNMEKLMQKKSQELSQRMRILEQAAQQPQTQPQAQDIAKRYEAIHNQAAQLAMRELGITDAEEFWPDAKIGNPAHAAAYQAAIFYVTNEQNQRQIVNQRVQQIVTEAQSNPQMEQDFDAAMYDLVKHGKTDQFRQVFEAKTRLINGQATLQDIETVEKHWQGVVTAKNTPKPVPKPVVDKPKVVPPKVEKSGVEQQEMKPTVNMNSFKKADYESKLEMIRLARRNGQI